MVSPLTPSVVLLVRLRLLVPFMLVMINLVGSKLSEFTTSLNVMVMKPSSMLKIKEFNTGGVISLVNTDT